MYDHRYDLRRVPDADSHTVSARDGVVPDPRSELLVIEVACTITPRLVVQTLEDDLFRSKSVT